MFNLIHIKKILILSLFFTLFSCKEDIIYKSKINLINKIGNSKAKLVDSNNIDVLFFCNQFNTYDSLGSTYRQELYEVAYITDGNDFVNPSSVTFNSQACTISPDNIRGNYSIIKAWPSTPYIATWGITNLNSLNFSITDTLLSPLLITNFQTFDTISKSTGKTISYSGYQNLGLTVHIDYDPGQTSYGISFDSNNVVIDPVFLNKSDNGGFNLSSSDLSSLLVGRYYDLTFYHEKYSRITDQSMSFGKYTRAGANIIFYLAP